MVLFSVGVVVLYLSKLPYGKSDSQVGLLMVKLIQLLEKCGSAALDITGLWGQEKPS